MGTSTNSDVKKLLELAERMGIPATEAMHQVRELSTEGESSGRPENTARPVGAERDSRRPAR
jgi:hypothetical protein